MKTNIHLEDRIVSFDDTRAKRDDVWEKIIEFVTEHQCFTDEDFGETTQFDAILLVADIIQTINFKDE